MRKIALFVFSFMLLFSGFVPKVQATEQCPGEPTGVGANASVPIGAQSHTITMDLSGYRDKELEFFIFTSKGRANSSPFKAGQNKEVTDGSGTLKVSGDTVTWVVTDKGVLGDVGVATVWLYKDGWVGYIGDRLCEVGKYETAGRTPPDAGAKCEIYVYQERGGEQCYSSGCMTGGRVTTYIEVVGMRDTDGSLYTGPTTFDINRPGWGNRTGAKGQAVNGSILADFEADGIGNYVINVGKSKASYAGADLFEKLCDEVKFESQETSQACFDMCGAKADINDQAATPNFDLCEQIPNEDQREKCIECFGEGASGGGAGMWTAIGCIPIEPTGIIQTLIRLGLGLGGGITLLLILAGAFRLSVSQGDPKAAEEAKEQITSAVIGLLFIIFSVVILRFIGVQVLQIPGFGG